MNQPMSSVVSPDEGPIVQPIADWASIPVAGALQSQRIEFELLSQWQRTITAMQHEMLESWARRFAGGVPRDAWIEAMRAS